MTRRAAAPQINRQYQVLVLLRLGPSRAGKPVGSAPLTGHLQPDSNPTHESLAEAVQCLFRVSVARGLSNRRAYGRPWYRSIYPPPTINVHPFLGVAYLGSPRRETDRVPASEQNLDKVSPHRPMQWQ